jgi:hypothetical protein
MKMTIRNFFLLAVVLMFSALGAVQAGADGAKCTKLLATVCNDCHNTDRVCDSIGGTKKKWKALIDWMISNGAELEDDEKILMIDCLSEPFDEAKKACQK